MKVERASFRNRITSAPETRDDCILFRCKKVEFGDLSAEGQACSIWFPFISTEAEMQTAEEKVALPFVIIKDE